MSTLKGKKAIGWLIVIFLVIIIVWIVLSKVSFPSWHEKTGGGHTNTTTGEQLPDQFKKVIHLKLGKDTTIVVPTGYDYECSGFGEKYCIQQKGYKKNEYGKITDPTFCTLEKSTAGGGIPYSKPSDYFISEFILSTFEKEVDVEITFTKKVG